MYAHKIGTEQSEDVLVYEELDDTVFVDITSSKDGVIDIYSNKKIYSIETRSFYRNMSL